MQCLLLLRLRVNLPNMFDVFREDIFQEKYILGKTVNCEGDTNHFVCDKWIERSVKEREREDKVR